ncbi:MAG: sulfatase-like hydrolase/transferase, partial [Planctomycetota bacterium]|nr:sulfatase-like hydrolase/transferase [Planctomycetota bacterium]
MLVPALALLTAPLCPIAPIPASAATGGNVCVIVLDDVVPGMLGCYAADFLASGRPSQGPASTPQIDSVLAAQGMRFGRVWSAPSCSPTRAAMLTGRVGSRSGIGQVIPPRAERPMPGLEPHVELLPGLLRLAPQPYASAAVGKWHLADHGQSLALPPHPLGVPSGTWFDRFAGTWSNLRGAATYDVAGYYQWTKDYATRIDSFASPCETGEPPCTLELDVNLSPLDYPSVDTVDDALTLVQQLPEPWFLWVAPHAAHVPLHPLPAGLPANPCTGTPAPGPGCSYPGLGLPESRARCMLEALDHQLGRLFCELDFDDTTVILVADNGWGARSILAPYSTARAKGTVYQGGVEVPLLVRSPAIPPQLRGTSSDALVSLSDVFATVGELAGAPPA